MSMGSFGILVRSAAAAAQQRTAIVRPTLCRRMINTAAADPPSRGNLSSMAYHFKRQQHMPYFLEYLMWVVFGSEALHLIWLKMEYKEYQEKTQHKIKLLEEIIERIEKGQEFTEDFRQEIRMVLMHGRIDHSQDDGYDDAIEDDYLDKLLASSEQQQQEQQSKAVPVTATTAPAAGLEKPASSWPTGESSGKEGEKKFFL